MISKPRSDSHLDWLDYARFFAALMVVLFHYLVNGIRNGKLTSLQPFDVKEIFQYGYLGVGFFFMISGFVIMWSATETTPMRFAIARFFRLWPTFLFCMSLTALFLVAWPSPLMPVSFEQYLGNLTMTPELFHVPSMDGVYWTLKHELAFYAVILIVLLAGLQRLALPLVEVWVLWQLIVWVFGIQTWYLVGYDAYFSTGCVFFFIFRDGPRPRLLVSLAACFYLALAATALPALASEHGKLQSPMVVVALVSAFFLFFWLFTTTRLRHWRLPHARFLGDLSYPLYLLHAAIGYTLISQFGSNDFRWTTIAVMVGLAVLMSAIVVTYVDRPARRLRDPAERRLQALLGPEFMSFTLRNLLVRPAQVGSKPQT